MKLQLITVLLLTLFFGFAQGKIAAISAVLGGAVYIVPTLAAVLFLKILNSHLNARWAGIGFIVAEILKMILALLLLILVFVYYPKLQFIPFFLALLTVSHFVFLILLKVYRYGK